MPASKSQHLIGVTVPTKNWYFGSALLSGYAIVGRERLGERRRDVRRALHHAVIDLEELRVAGGLAELGLQRDARVPQRLADDLALVVHLAVGVLRPPLRRRRGDVAQRHVVEE